MAIIEMDPLKELPEEILYEIFKYLNVADLLSLSIVSKPWYNFIRELKQFMANVAVLYDWDHHDEDIEPILNSTRLYQNFKFQYYNYQLAGAPHVIQNMATIINKFAASVVCIETSHDMQVCELPKLQKLMFTEKNYNRSLTIYENGLLKNRKNMRSLLIMRVLGKGSLEIMRRNLEKMDNLKGLTIRNKDFLNDWEKRDYKFKLKAFNWHWHCQIQKGLKILLASFLNAHISTLEEIYFQRVTYDDMVFFLSKFKNLRKLKIANCNYITANDSYPTNETIEELIIDDFLVGTHSLQNFVTFLPKIKNLRRLNILVLNGEILEAIFGLNSIRNVEYTLLKWATHDQISLMMNNPRNIKFTTF